MNIQAKLFTGFAVIVGISAAMGLNAVKSIDEVSNLTNQLYEQPMMANNFARSAQANLSKTNVSLSLALTSSDRSAFDHHIAAAEAFQEEFASDLEVVEERIVNESGAAIVLEITSLFDQWTEISKAIAETGGSNTSDRAELSLKKNALARLSEEKFDLLIETTALDGYNFIQFANETNDSGVLVQLVALIVTVAIGFLTSLVLGRGIARPITAMTAAMTKLANGDNDVEVPAVSRKDEIGDMAAAIQVFKENALEMERLQAETVKHERTAADEKRSALLMLADELDNSVKSVVDAVAGGATEMQTSAELMATIAEETSLKSQAAASATEQAATNVQTVSSAAEEMAASINEIADQVAQSADMAKAAVAEAQRTN
ncbi:MAG: HAMP domain-containing protein, partial [Pseudomonadales bacterium]